MITTGESLNVESRTAADQPCEHERLSRRLRQLCAGARERVGLSAGVRPRTATEQHCRRGAELPGNLRESATGQGAHDHPGTECDPVRKNVWRNQAGSRRHPGPRTSALNKLVIEWDWVIE